MSTRCINPGCGKETNNKDGICSGCKIEASYQAMVKANESKVNNESIMNQEEEIENMSQKKKCTSEGCERSVQKEGLCYKCYVEKHGKPPYGNKKESGVKKAKELKEVKKLEADPQPKKVEEKQQSKGETDAHEQKSKTITFFILPSEYPKLCNSLHVLFGELSKGSALKEALRPQLKKMEAEL